MTIPGILRTFYLDLRQQGERTVGFERYQGEEHTVHLGSGRNSGRYSLTVESPLWPLDVWEVMGSCQTTILTPHMWKNQNVLVIFDTLPHPKDSLGRKIIQQSLSTCLHKNKGRGPPQNGCNCILTNFPFAQQYIFFQTSMWVHVASVARKVGHLYHPFA